ncbi:MAG TPA: ABC transporter permease [Bacteroidales bacterium]|jgi:putative ABC transport system permease protein|nr:ABC transporter permease [Bacteroidales bacterium]
MYFRLLRESFIFAIKSVIVNRLRTFLSLFGISIGIFSIISVFTVLDWMANSIRESISSMGDNVIYVQKFPWSFNPNLAWWDIIKWPTPSMDDYQAVIKKSTKSDAVCLLASQHVTMKYKNNLANDITIAAVTPDFENIRSFDLDKGRYFSSYEGSAGKNIIVLGAELANRLFEDQNPVGQTVSVSGYRATVIGVLKKEGKGGISDNGLDEIAVIPFNFGKSFINMRNRFVNTQLMIRAKAGVAIDELSDETVMILRAARRIKPDEVNNFSVNKASLLTQGFNAVFAGINLGGWVIGGFAILVGGFGIANIMFVSVRERTNIIGIQKALGAKRSFILQQFLIESVLLSVAGGLIGLLLIYLGTIGINYFFDLDMHLTFGNFFLAIFISGLIGIVAGYAPALSAAKMDPVEAIGYSF